MKNLSQPSLEAKLLCLWILGLNRATQGCIECCQQEAQLVTKLSEVFKKAFSNKKKSDTVLKTLKLQCLSDDLEAVQNNYLVRKLHSWPSKTSQNFLQGSLMQSEVFLEKGFYFERKKTAHTKIFSLVIFCRQSETTGCRKFETSSMVLERKC